MLRSWSHSAGVHIQDLPLTSHMTLGKLLNSSVLLFPHLQLNVSIAHTGVVRIYGASIYKPSMRLGF